MSLNYFRSTTSCCVLFNEFKSDQLVLRQPWFPSALHLSFSWNHLNGLRGSEKVLFKIVSFVLQIRTLICEWISVNTLPIRWWWWSGWTPFWTSMVNRLDEFDFVNLFNLGYRSFIDHRLPSWMTWSLDLHLSLNVCSSYQDYSAYDSSSMMNHHWCSYIYDALVNPIHLCVVVVEVCQHNIPIIF